MHTPSPLPGKTTKPSFEARLTAYAQESKTTTQTTSPTASLGKLCACSMAAGAVLGLQQPAFSAIVHSGALIEITGTRFTANFGPAEGNFVFLNPDTAGEVFLSLNTNQRAVMNPGNGTDIVRAINFGYTIQSQLPTNEWRDGSNLLLNQDVPPYGEFFGASGFIGVRFEAPTSGEWHYGWITYDGTPPGDGPPTIMGWAYEDCVNVAINAGETRNSLCQHDPDPEPTAIPTLSEWGMIILVALLAGLGMHRIKRQKDDDDHLAGA